MWSRSNGFEPDVTHCFQLVKIFIIRVIIVLNRVRLCVFQELARERQENVRLLKAHQDKDDLIGKLKEEIDLLNRVSPASVNFLLWCLIF